jgi:hypothetical protein
MYTPTTVFAFQQADEKSYKKQIETKKKICRK